MHYYNGYNGYNGLIISYTGRLLVQYNSNSLESLHNNLHTWIVYLNIGYLEYLNIYINDK